MSDETEPTPDGRREAAEWYRLRPLDVATRVPVWLVAAGVFGASVYGLWKAFGVAVIGDGAMVLCLMIILLHVGRVVLLARVPVRADLIATVAGVGLAAEVASGLAGAGHWRAAGVGLVALTLATATGRGVARRIQDSLYVRWRLLGVAWLAGAGLVALIVAV
jgi:hypothetical protein